MTAEAVTTTYSVAEPFAEARKWLREALAARDLRITGEMDLSERIWRRLRISVEPCVVMLVWPSARLLRVTAVSASTPLFLPLHVVVSGRGGRTEIHLLKRPRLADKALMEAISQLQFEVAQAVETIAMRPSLVN
jgi:uncharacterized protein (DUF302 family)